MSIWKTAKALLTIALCLCLLAPVDARATQIVTQEDLHQDLLKSWEEREQNLATLKGLLSTEAAREMIAKTGTDYGKVMRALPNLDDEELSRLASQARVAQANFAAGLSDREIVNVLIIVLLVVAIIVVVAAVAD
ncbi:PA2779 family protein [bacterium]|nr:PA2779 family protein [bacterium]MCI0603887.1 PA2779 family protein [bacterium]